MVEVKVKCKINEKFCAKCCYQTDMPLSMEDIIRISSLGFDPKEFVELDEYPKLKNVDGHCYFLNVTTGECKIYEHRPFGCRLYPLIYDPKTDSVIVDAECPQASQISKEDIKKYEKIVILFAKKFLK